MQANGGDNLNKKAENMNSKDDLKETTDICANETEHKACCACQAEGIHKTKERTGREYKDLVHRLNRIEGQVRGVRNMLDKDAYCVDILTQVAAINAALNSFSKVLLANHIKTCVADDIRAGHDEVIDELVATLQKLMK